MIIQLAILKIDSEDKGGECQYEEIDALEIEGHELGQKVFDGLRAAALQAVHNFKREYLEEYEDSP